MRKLYRHSMYLVVRWKNKTFTFDDVGGLHYDENFVDENIYTYNSFEDFVDFLALHCSSFPHATYKWFGKEKCRIADCLDHACIVFNAEDFVSAEYHVLCNETDSDQRRTIKGLASDLNAPDFIAYCKDHGMTICPMK